MQNADILALAGLRIDGRKPTDLRTMKHNINFVPTADGSVYLEQGLNKVVVLVHGPHEPAKKLSDHSSDKV
jgi:exosome complex component RRP41